MRAKFGGGDETLVSRRKPGTAIARAVPQQWVFDGVDLGTHEFFMEMVPARYAATLLPIIQRNIVPGSTIRSDEWAGYNRLGNSGYVHQTSISWIR